MADTQERPGKPFGFKRITDYTDAELDLAVKLAKDHCEDAGLEFFDILRGVDAYMEKRRRKDATRPGSNVPLS